MADTQLKSSIDITVRADYQRTDNGVSPAQLNIQKVRYTDLTSVLLNGWGQDRADLFYTARRSLNNAVEIIDLDGGIVDNFGNLLNYDAVKGLVIFNRTETDGAILDVRFKSEYYRIGPRGFRVLWEPRPEGVEAVLSSGSEDEGSIMVSCDLPITYDIIIIGSAGENSSSSSGGTAQ